MAEKVLKVKTVSEVAEAISGLTDLQGSLKGVGTAAFEAAGKSKAEWKALGAEWEKAVPTAKNLGVQVQGVESALNAMGRASSQSQLESSLVKSQVEFRRLQATMREVAATGGTIDDGVVASMNVMRASIDAGKAKLNEMKTSTAEARRELGLLGSEGDKSGKSLGGLKDQTAGLAKGMMSASGIGGQYGEILEKLSLSGGKAANAMGALALKGLGFVAATKVSIDLFKMVNKYIQDHGNYLEKAIDATVRFAAAERDASKDVTGLAADIDLENEALTEHTKALAGQIVARRALLNEVEKTAATFNAALPGWESTEDRAKKLKEQIDAVSAKFKSFGSTGADMRKEVEANQAPLAAFVAMLEKEKVALDTLPEPLQKAIEHLKSLSAAATDAVPGLTSLKDALEGIGKGDVAESIDAVAKALRLISLTGGDVGAAVTENAEGLQALRTAAEGSYETLAQFRTEVMDQIPAYQATALASQQYAGSLEAIGAATADYEAKRRAANEADIAAGIQMAEMKERAADMAYAIDTIGEAWMNATGQAAGFTVEVRRATKAVKETTPEFDAFIESLAVTSDEFERMVPYVGALIADLEAGRISPDEFGKAIDRMRVAFMQIQGVSGQMFGDVESLFNRLRDLVNDFTFGDNPRNKRPRR